MFFDGFPLQIGEFMTLRLEFIAAGLKLAAGIIDLYRAIKRRTAF